MDNILYGALSNTVVEVHFLSKAGFITRGLFSNCTRLIPQGQARHKEFSFFACYEFFRKRVVKIENEAEITGVLFENPDGVRPGQLIYGECQPSKEWVRGQVDRFILEANPFGRGIIKDLDDKHKVTAIEFFSGESSIPEGVPLNHLIDDLICSEIFINVPKELLIEKFLSKAESMHKQWDRLIDLYAELSISEIKKDENIPFAQKPGIIARIRKAPLHSPTGLKSALDLSEYWPKELMPKPSSVFS
ncbi:MAG: hypothetical protein CMO74_14605 [Verrucomicrobiales bacterium]|nr:hypothetical protein [Verrucomicrobiales bacterium]|tara:strand:+ start:31482 stop:32222 length:741 start_codon:yes stop_codon:yes gene_type:complete